MRHRRCAVLTALLMLMALLSGLVGESRAQGGILQQPTATACRVTATSSDLGLTSAHCQINATTGAGGQTTTLPQASGFTFSKTFTVCKVDTGAGLLTLAPFGSNTINSVAGPKTLSTQSTCFEARWESPTGWLVAYTAALPAENTIPVVGAAGTLVGLTCTNGQFPIGSTGAAPVCASLTPGSNVTLTPGPNSLQIDVPGTGGDASTNTASSVDNECAKFSGTGGKTFKRCTETGILTGLSGVLGTITTSAGLLAALSDATGTGAAVFGTAPTFTTQIITPAAIGGGGVGSSLILQSTTGVGATDSILFKVGNNGATTAATISTTGKVLVSGTTSGTFQKFHADLAATGNAASAIANYTTTTLSGDMGGALPYTDGIRSDYTYTGTNVGNGFLSPGRALATYVTYGSTTVEAMGTAGGQYNTMTVLGSSTQENEHFLYGGLLTYHIGTGYANTATPGTAWVVDLNVMGPIAVQQRGLNGFLMGIFNHYDGQPTLSPSGGMWIMTAPGTGIDDALHTAATTYPIGVGVGVVGKSSGGTGRGFDIAFQAGGAGSPRTSQTTPTLLGTAFYGTTYDTYGLHLEGAAGSGKAIFVASTGGIVQVDTSLTLGTPLAVASGGTGLAAGTSGGIPYYSDATTLASSGALGAEAFMKGGGAGAAPTTLSTLVYNATYTGHSESPGQPSVVLTDYFDQDRTETGTTAFYPSFEARTTWTPSGSAAGAGRTAGKVTIRPTGANAFGVATAADIFAFIADGNTGGGTSLIASSGIASNAAAATVTTIIGQYANASQTHASSVSTNLWPALVDPSDGGSTTLAGTTTNFDGVRIRGMSLASLTAANRTALHIEAMTGTAGTSDYAISSAATQPSALTGKLAQGGVFVPTYALSFLKTAAATVGIERSTSGAGATLTLQAGSAESGATNSAGGALVLATGIPTGSNSSSIFLSTYGGGASGTSDGTATTHTISYRGFLPALVAAQTIAAGNTVTADACGGVKRVTAAGAVATDTTNTFTAPAAANANCVMHVCNVGANAITLDNNALFVSIGGADVVLGANDCTIVGSTGSGGAWYSLGALVAN